MEMRQLWHTPTNEAPKNWCPQNLMLMKFLTPKSYWDKNFLQKNLKHPNHPKYDHHISDNPHICRRQKLRIIEHLNPHLCIHQKSDEPKARILQNKSLWILEHQNKNLRKTKDSTIRCSWDLKPTKIEATKFKAVYL